MIIYATCTPNWSIERNHSLDKLILVLDNVSTSDVQIPFLGQSVGIPVFVDVDESVFTGNKNGILRDAANQLKIIEAARVYLMQKSAIS